MSKKEKLTAKPIGRCHLVGAGPGDLGLVTLRAKEVIEQAEVIVYDYLCNPEMLAWAPSDAEVIYAGKKAGAHTLRQEEISALLVDKTRSGKRVVRLKGGDPFVFGRGGEEAVALARACVAFEVVPGVSSAIAGPAYAGIPVTQRGHVSQLTVFTGHEDPEKGGSGRRFRPTRRYPRHQGHAHGRRAAGIHHAPTPRRGRGCRAARRAHPLGHYPAPGNAHRHACRHRPARRRRIGFEAPAVAVFGEVVRLREELNWFETRPLFGKRIVVTRTRKQAGALSGKLRALGADVLEIPTIRIEPPTALREFAELVKDSHTYDWIVFTSPNGVDAFFHWFYRLFSDARDIGGARIAAVGPATAARIREFHLKVDVQPETAVAEALVEALQREMSVENLKILLVRPESTREVVAQRTHQTRGHRGRGHGVSHRARNRRDRGRR